MDELIKCGALQKRRIKGLPENSPIKYPYDQEVAKVKQRWSDSTIKTDVQQLQGAAPEDEAAAKASADEFTNTFESVSASRFGSDASARAAPVAAAEPGGNGGEKPPPPDGRDAEILKQLRKTHGVWDRTHREWQGLLSKCQQNKYTKDSEMVSELEAKMRKCGEDDEKNLALERKVMGGTKLVDKELLEAHGTTTSLADTIKKGQETVKLLKVWLKYKPA